MPRKKYKIHAGQDGVVKKSFLSRKSAERYKKKKGIKGRIF